MRKFWLMAVLMIVVVSMASGAMAACEALSEIRGKKMFGDDRPQGHVYKCTADSANTIADLPITDTTGQLQAIDTVYTLNGAANSLAPTSVTPVVKTVDGVTVFTGSEVTTPGGRNKPDVPEGFPGGLTISQTGTFDSGDVWWLVLVFL